MALSLPEDIVPTKKKDDSERKTLSHQEYFQLCEELRNQREYLLDENPGYDDCCDWLAEKLGFRPNVSALQTARKQTGVDWKPRRVKSHGDSAEDIKVLARELVRIIEDFGGKPSADLVRLAGVPVPASTIQDASTIPVVRSANHG